jgi:hypothetical protein
VCDELILVTHGLAEVEGLLEGIGDERANSERAGRLCDIRVKVVEEPALVGFGGYGAYLLYGTVMASEPDWMLAVEADYLISPEEAGRFREILNGAALSRELVMAKVVTLNFDGTKKVYNPDFKKWYVPHDGYVWDRPVGCRPKRGIFPAPYGGVDGNNVQMNCEGYVCMRPGKWGHSFNSKFLNHNPSQFDIERTDVVVEHLTFTRDARALVSKLNNPYFYDCCMTLGRVVDGDEPYQADYAELRQVAADYAGHLEFLRWLRGR